MKLEVIGIEPEKLVKRAMFLAWEACGGPIGMGQLQDKPFAKEDEVWNNVKTAGDYPGNFRGSRDGDVYGDYVFGRMMKTGMKYNDAYVTISKEKASGNYQAWARKFEDQPALIKAAAASIADELGKNATVMLNHDENVGKVEVH